MSALKELRTEKNRLILAFGATGDRDTSKRPKMGAIADAMADIIILTDDDTYTEDSARIIAMVQAGVSRDIGENFYILPDRREAIEKSLEIAREGDIVLIAGKGSENVQITNAGSIPWNDKEEVLRVLGE